MDTLKNIWRELWSNKPLLITVVVALAVLAYFAWQSFHVPTADQGSPGVLPDGTGPEGSQPPITPTPAPGQPPVNIFFPPVTAVPGGVTPPSNTKGHQQQPARTVTVTPWPTKNSTLWGIAQNVYGNGTQWPKIYQANKSKIGNNPNLLHPGMVLVIP